MKIIIIRKICEGLNSYLSVFTFLCCSFSHILIYILFPCILLFCDAEGICTGGCLFIAVLLQFDWVLWQLRVKMKTALVLRSSQMIGGWSLRLYRRKQSLDFCRTASQLSARLISCSHGCREALNWVTQTHSFSPGGEPKHFFRGIKTRRTLSKNTHFSHLSFNTRKHSFSSKQDVWVAASKRVSYYSCSILGGKHFQLFCSNPTIVTRSDGKESKICRRASCWSLCAPQQWHLTDVTHTGRVPLVFYSILGNVIS